MTPTSVFVNQSAPQAAVINIYMYRLSSGAKEALLQSPNRFSMRYDVVPVQ